jgi:hypothetical protein
VPKDYILFNENCNSFAAEVAKVLGIKLPTNPPGTTLPIQYIKALENINQVQSLPDQENISPPMGLVDFRVQ